MKQRILLLLLIVSMWPLIGMADEPTFYSRQGTYTLSPTIAVTI